MITPIGDGMDEQATRDAQSLIDATLNVLTSSDFARNLSSIREVVGPLWLSPFGDTLSADRVLAAYLGYVEAHRALPVHVKWVARGNTTSLDSKRWIALVRLDEETRERWRSNDVVSRSCAINTLAHELSHAVPLSQDRLSNLFADRGRPWAHIRGRSLASYTIGAVAQCTYLDGWRQMTGGWLSTCVRSWGTNQFYSAGCSGS